MMSCSFPVFDIASVEVRREGTGEHSQGGLPSQREVPHPPTHVESVVMADR